MQRRMSSVPNATPDEQRTSVPLAARRSLAFSPAMELTAMLRVNARRFSNHVPGSRNISRKKWCSTGEKERQTSSNLSRPRNNHH
jgi:hypothetical protein